MCLFGERDRVNQRGSAKTDSSLLAEMFHRVTMSPARIFWPRRPMS
jgi:hypothetical protein